MRRGLAPAELDRLLDLLLPGRTIERAASGQPTVRGQGGLMLSLSHAVGATAVAFAPFPVGIDIERCEADADALAIDAELFGKRDHAFLAALDGEGRRDAFYRLWTLKEARLKRLGRGLADSALPDIASLAGDDMGTAWLDAPAGRYCLGLCWGN
jgi:4'-phosphopantetheinyl transferase